MKILFDLQCCQTASRARGIGRYSSSLAKSIAKNPRGHDIHILLNEKFSTEVFNIRADFENLIPKRNLHVYRSPSFKEMDSSSWCFQSAHHIRQEYIETVSPDMVHISSLFEWWDVPVSIPQNCTSHLTSVTLYDLIPFTRPNALPNVSTADAWYKNQLLQLRSANCVLAISDYSKSEAVSLLSLDESRVFNISAGVTDVFYNPSLYFDEQKKNIFNQHSLDRAFVLTVGTIEKRKNIAALIEAWGHLPRDLIRSHQLVIVGEQSCEAEMAKIESALRRYSLSPSDILFLRGIPDSELRILYKSCKLFVLPSLHEGFGLPVAEAMVCGAATISSSTTSLPEVVELASAMFNPLNMHEIRDILYKALTDDLFLETLRFNSLKQSSRFSWDYVAAKALDAFELQFNQQLTRTKPSVTEEDFRKSILEKLSAISGHPSNEDILFAADAVAANRPRNKRQLLIDVTVLAESDARTGIHRVVRNYSRQLLQEPPYGFEVRLIRCRGNTWNYAIKLEQKISDQKLKMGYANEPVVEVFENDIFLGADLGLTYIPQHRDWLEIAKVRGAKICFIIYDILPALAPQYFHKGINTYFVPWLKFIGEMSNNLICISETVCLEVKEWYRTVGLETKKPPIISYVHMGADLDSHQVSINDALPEVALGEKTKSTFLIVSTIEPRKGHQQVLEAFNILWDRGVDTKLIIVGKVGWNVEQLIENLKSHPQLGKKLIWFNNASDEVLERCYRLATALISSSYGEGFGLPLIEGAQRKLPIIARDIPVFREIAESHAFYFRETHPVKLADAIEYWLSLYSLNQHPKSDHMPWQTWAESAQKLKVLLEI